MIIQTLSKVLAEKLRENFNIITGLKSSLGHTHFDKTRFIQIESRHNKKGVTTDLANYYWVSVVPGGGFEPPTRGFSVHCSTPELPGQVKARCLGAIVLGRHASTVQRDFG